MSDNSKGPAAGEYPIRALVMANPEYQSQPLMRKHFGQIINVKWSSLGTNIVLGPKGENGGEGWAWWPERDVILSPTESQIAEERVKAGLSPLTAPAVPEPVRAEGPDPLVEALQWAEALEITAKDKPDREMIETNAATYRNLARILRALAALSRGGAQ